jgi:hypothetical protein
MLLKLVGLSELDTSANSTANAEIKADIYISLDITGSMAAAEIANTKAAANQFIGYLGLDPANTQGPQVAVGRFLGERCRRNNPGTNSNLDPTTGSAATASKWFAPGNWVTTAGWCEDNDSAPNLSTAFSSASAPPCSGEANTGASGCSSSSSGGCLPSAPVRNPFWPGSQTTCMLGMSAANAVSAVNAIDYANRDDCLYNNTPPSNASAAASPNLEPYWGNATRPCDTLSGTSHTAGLGIAYQELQSSRSRFAQGQTQYRRVVVMQTDGTSCSLSTPYSMIPPGSSQVGTYVPGATAPQHGNSKSTRQENKTLALANTMKTTPNAFSGVEIFTIMAVEPGANTCPDETVLDTEATQFPSCPDATSLAGAGARSHVDDYMIALSSSTPGTCDHYAMANITNAAQLAEVYRKILTRLAVAKLQN